MSEAVEEKKIKMIWDFRGPDAERIAEHHVIHLRQYITMHHLSMNIAGVETISKDHHLAFLVVKESEMKQVRDALKPHRGQYYRE